MIWFAVPIAWVVCGLLAYGSARGFDDCPNPNWKLLEASLGLGPIALGMCVYHIGFPACLRMRWW